MQKVKRGRGRPRKVRQKIKNPKVFDIEERLTGCSRREAQHIIYVGTLVEHALLGEIGAVIKALTAGRVSAELASNKDGKLSSERVLGRVEMANSLWDDLEQFVIDKDNVNKPIPEPNNFQESVTESEARQYESFST